MQIRQKLVGVICTQAISRHLNLLIWQGECSYLQEGDVPGKGAPVFVLSADMIK